MDAIYFALAKTTNIEECINILNAEISQSQSYVNKNKLAGALAYIKLTNSHEKFIKNLREILYNQFCDVINLAKK